MNIQSIYRDNPFSRIQILSILIIVLFAVVVRFYKLGEVPHALNRDEASLGFTAYSILQTGRDEHQNSYPLQIQSFGDWKLPLYVYATIPVVQTFGLNEWSVRFPSAFSGVAIVLLSIIWTRLLLEKETQTTLISWLPIVVGGFMAVNPWAVHVSRIAYEANVSLALFMLGLVSVYMALQRQLSQERWMKKHLVWFYPIAAFSFGLTLFGYHSFQVFMPLFGIFLLISNYKAFVELFKKHFIVFALSAIIVGLFVIAIFISRSGSANSTKFGGISPFSESRYKDELFTKRQIVGGYHPFLAKIYANRVTIFSTKLAHNIWTLWNPQFLFISGGSHGSHSIIGIANFYIIESVFIIAGLLHIAKQKFRWGGVLLIWLVFASIAPIITIEPNHPIRFLPGLIPLVILSSYGASRLIGWLFSGNFIQRTVCVVIVSVCMYSVSQYMITYFIVAPERDTDRWPWYMKEITQTLAPQLVSYTPVLMQGESSSPYIYFLFYSPEVYQDLSSDLTFYPPTDEGFVHVKQLKNITFGKINWETEKNSLLSKLYVLEEQEIPGFVKEDPRYTIEKQFVQKYSKYKWSIIRYTPELLHVKNN